MIKVLMRMWRKGNTYTLFVGILISTAVMEKKTRVLKNLKREPPYDPVIPLKGNEISVSRRHLHFHVHCSIIHNSKEIQITKMATA
jgi:hypothetical protein